MNLINDISAIDKEIQNAFKKKEVIILDFLKDIEVICDVFYEIWKSYEKTFENDLENIAKKHEYTFSYGYANEFAKDQFTFENIKRNFIQNFPIYNIDGEYIFDELPRANYKWSFIDKSNKETINIEVTPIDIYSRYPTDPDNNNTIFNFILKSELFNKVKSEKDRNIIKNLLIDYFQEIKKEYLNNIEEKIEKKAKSINKKLKGIDFSDEELVNELKKRINQI